MRHRSLVFLEMDGRGQKYADVAYMHDRCTLIECAAIDDFRENHDLDAIADTTTSEKRIRRDGVTDERVHS
jgi:hypothetical protein